MKRAARQEQFTFYVSSSQLALLRKLNFPCSESLLARADPTDDGFELTGSRYELEDLVGWVAGEANHSRSPQRAELLNELADEIEAALASKRMRL